MRKAGKEGIQSTEKSVEKKGWFYT